MTVNVKLVLVCVNDYQLYSNIAEGCDHTVSVLAVVN